MEHHKITVKGRVQGVSFRVYTKNKAQELDLNGIVKNMRDGSVYIEAEGPLSVLQTFEDWCHFGSPRSHVASVEVESGKLKGYGNFEIKY